METRSNILEARSGKRKILASRVAFQRTQKEWSQVELAEKLSEFSPKKTAVSHALVSMWESGKRSIPQVYLEPLSDLLGVSSAYLCGMTDNPDETFAQIEHKKTAKPKESVYEIDYWQLHAFDKQPVYVVFSNYEHENGWAIYNKNRHIFVFYEDALKETSLMKLQVHFYVKDITRVVDPLNRRKSLDMASMLEKDRVYITMDTPDRAVRFLYDGWYHHNENHSALINDRGLVLPYEGLKMAYHAYAYADSGEDILFKEDAKKPGTSPKRKKKETTTATAPASDTSEETSKEQ